MSDADGRAPVRELDDAEAAALFSRLKRAYLAQMSIQGVVRAQVEGALETSHTLASTVISEAHAAHSVAGELVASMQRASTTATQVLDRVSEAIDSADVLEREVLEERTRALEAASESSRNMVKEQHRLEGLGEKAQGLGMRIRIVAMNTNIEAMRAQTAQNSVIGVLAREIGSLAVEVQKLGLELTESVHALSTLLDRDLVEGMAREAQAIEEVRERLAHQVTALRGSHDELKDFRDSALSQVADTTKKVSTHVINTLGGVQNQDILRQRLEQVVAVLSKLSERDAAMRDALLGVATLPHAWVPLEPAELSASYVMDSQRTAHAHETHNDESAADPAAGLPTIELF